jgi:hypothetical protein
MFKLAGALLSKPQVLQRAARMMPESPVVQTMARLAKDGGSELLSASLPGAVATAGLGALTTGNPLAGLIIGATDLGLSYGGSRAISKFAPQYAGRYRAYVTPEQMKAGTPVDPKNLKMAYEPSWQQSAAMLAGSVAAPVTLEPLFLQMQQQQNTNQLVTQQQQLGQQEMLNDFYYPQTADGTLYQTQGLPPRVY